MGAGVVQVFALQIDLRPAAEFAQPLGVIQRRGTADVMPKQAAQLGLERWIAPGLIVLHRQFVQSADQRFRHVAAAIVAKPTRGVGYVAQSIRRNRLFHGAGHKRFSVGARTETRPVRAASGKLLVFDRGEARSSPPLACPTGGRR